MWGAQPRSTWNWKAEPRLQGARATVESSSRWGRDGTAGVKGQVWGCLLKRTCWGEPSAHTSGIWELAVCDRALPDEFSHFHFIKFLVKTEWQTQLGMWALKGDYWKDGSAFSNFSPGGQEEQSREKDFWILADIPITFQKALCPHGRAAGMVSAKISREKVWARIWLPEESRRMAGIVKGTSHTSVSSYTEFKITWPQIALWVTELQGIH